MSSYLQEIKKEIEQRRESIIIIRGLNVVSILLFLSIYVFIFSVGRLTIPAWIVKAMYVVDIFAIVTVAFQKVYWHKYFNSLKRKVDYRIKLDSEKYKQYKKDVINLENKLSLATNIILLFLFIIMIFEISTRIMVYDKQMVTLVSSFFGYFTGPVLAGGLIFYMDLIKKYKIINWLYFDLV
ncbi:hypothetical protein [Leuconostoc mesenteroides]|uniref:hypothetical protein n=1 Tax=Leuconostoc mesenteroides TaxID=1245 RepID=UPI0023614D89|nr:hypothetical protein [Leuconostoc mesenteroides]